jgi:hypothetical protein
MPLATGLSAIASTKNVDPIPESPDREFEFLREFRKEYTSTIYFFKSEIYSPKFKTALNPCSNPR